MEADGMLGHDELIERVRQRYNTWGHLFLPSVRDGTGHMSSRTVDALVLGLFQSRGYELTGFEAKASRADWLTELRNPAKAESVFPFCHRWYVVANKGVVKKGELPKGWGLMVAYKKAFRAVTRAPELNPVPMDIPFLASILEHMRKHSACGRNIKEVEELALEEGRKRAENTYRYEAARAVDRFERLRLLVTQFEVKSGLEIASPYPHKVGQIATAVKAVLAGEIDERILRTAKYDVEKAQRQLNDARFTLGELERSAKQQGGSDAT